MSQTRVERLNASFQKEISDILQSELKDPRIGFCSVTRVDLTQDMRQARVYVSVLGHEEQQAATLAGLESAAGFIRSEIARRIRLRYAPEMVFRLDTSIAHGVRIAEILNQIKKDEGTPAKPEAAPGASEARKPPEGNAK
ncbi:MAG TPA: 30S ribosome-binding factor RbfA [Bacillota bacterium]|jgi:ribosome-binding factor A